MIGGSLLSQAQIIILILESDDTGSTPTSIVTPLSLIPIMQQMTVSLREDQKEQIENLVGKGNPYESKSEAMRGVIDEYNQRGAQIERLQEENQRLHNERNTILNAREENTELVEYVEEERSMTKRKAQAGILTRGKWWLMGMDDE